MRQQFKEKLNYTKSVILLNSPFIGTLLFSVPIVETDKGYEGVYLVGKKIKIHEKLVDQLDRMDFTALITKFIFHLIFLHINRMKNTNNRTKFAVSASQAINSLLDSELGSELSSYISLKNERFNYENDFKGKSAEQIYELLGDCISDSMLLQSMDLIHSELMTKDESDSFQNDILRSHDLNKNFGNIPASIEILIEQLRKPKVNWKRILKQNIQKQFIDYSYNEPDRRFLGNNIILPTITGEKFKVLIGVDLSGSINKEQSDSFLSDIYNLLNVFNGIEIILMTFDTQAYNVKLIKSRKDLFNYEMLGGGGTDCYEVLKYANDNKNKIDYTLIFTDGYLEFHKEFKKTKNLYWLIYDSDVIPDYGKHFVYDTDNR